MSGFEMRMADRIVKRGNYIRYAHKDDNICPHTNQRLHGQNEAFAKWHAQNSIRIIMDDVRLALRSDTLNGNGWTWEKHAQRAIPPCQRVWAEFINAHGNYIGACITVSKRGDRNFGMITESPHDDCNWIVAYHIMYCLSWLTQNKPGAEPRYEWGLEGVWESQYDSVGRYLAARFADTPLAKGKLGAIKSTAITFAHGLSLMNHKSYEARKIKPPCSAVRNRVEAECGAPLLSYRQLWVNCLDSMKSGVMPGDGEFRDVREHFVRGHFKYYTEDKPLFGRLGQHGWIWADSHVRGNKERGTVVKDYAIATG